MPRTTEQKWNTETRHCIDLICRKNWIKSFGPVQGQEKQVDLIFVVVNVTDVYLALVCSARCWGWFCPHGVRKWKHKHCPLKMAANRCWTGPTICRGRTGILFQTLDKAWFLLDELVASLAKVCSTLNVRGTKIFRIQPNHHTSYDLVVRGRWMFQTAFLHTNGSIFETTMMQTLISILKQFHGHFMQTDGFWLLDMRRWQLDFDRLPRPSNCRNADTCKGFGS